MCVCVYVCVFVCVCVCVLYVGIYNPSGYSDYWLYFYCYIYNVSANASFPVFRYFIEPVI